MPETELVEQLTRWTDVQGCMADPRDRMLRSIFDATLDEECAARVYKPTVSAQLIGEKA